MAHAFFLGVDVVENEASDDHGATTLTLIEKEKHSGDAEPSFRLDRIVHRSPAPTSEDVANQIQSLVAKDAYIGRTSIIVNRTTPLGQGIVDALRDCGLDPVAARLTGGQGAVAGDRDETGVTVAEYDVVKALADRYRAGTLDLLEHESKDASRLAQGIQSFIAYVTDDVTDGVADADGPGTPPPEGMQDAPKRPESYDNYVTSAGLAVWLSTERSFDPTQRLKEDLPTEPMV